jgi:hypothetical protein
MKKLLTIVLILSLAVVFSLTGFAHTDECGDDCIETEVEVAEVEGGDETGESEIADANESIATTGSDVKLDTGIVGVAILGAVAVLAAGAVVISKKRK